MSFPGGLHQLVEQGRSLRGAGCLPTGQDGGKLQLFGGFQRRKRVLADIKGAVQRASCRRPASRAARRAAA